MDVGDVGPKMCLINNDNGYLKFDNFRQPRSALLSRYVQVAEDGTFSSLGANAIKLAYGGMLNLRTFIVASVHYYLAR